MAREDSRDHAGASALAGFILLATLASGCSFFMKSVDSKRPVSRAPQCSESRAAPNLDVGMAIFPTLAVAIAAATEDRTGNAGPSSGTFVALYIPVALVYSVSAMIGYNRASRCRRENMEWAEWRNSSLEDRLSDVRSNKSEQLLATLGRQLRLEMKPSEQDKKVLLLSARSRGACIDMQWSSALRQVQSALLGQGLTQVECRDHEETVWSGPITELPDSAQDTSCGLALATAIRERDQGKRKAMVAGMPSACRYGARAFEWVNQALGAAITGDCQWSRALAERVRLIDPTYYQEKLADRPDFMLCSTEAQREP